MMVTTHKTSAIRGLHLTLHSLESVGQLFEEVLDDALVVVAPAENVIQGRETVSLAALLLVIELLRIELVATHNPPVIVSRVHREARRQRSVDANNHRVLARAAVPWEMIALHERDHLPQTSV